MPRTPDLSRRRLLGGGLAAVALGGLAAACGDDSTSSAGSSGSAGPSPSASPSAAPWSYTDAIDQTIELDTTPTRIVAYGDAAAALINFGIRPVGIFHYLDPADDVAFKDLDLSGVETVGSAYGEISLEALVALQPDLILTTYYGEDTPDTMYGFKDKTQIDKIRAIAPITGIMQTGSALDVIADTEELVASLGVDVTGGKVAADKAAFEEASAAVTAAAASGLSIVPIYAEDANLYYAKAPDDPALKYYQDLGVNFTEVEGDDYYWEIVSWEQADTYDPDIILYATRDSYTPEQLLDQPTFARLAAAKAGQLHPWTFTSMDYVSQAAYLTQLAGWLSSDTKLT